MTKHAGGSKLVSNESLKLSFLIMPIIKRYIHSECDNMTTRDDTIVTTLLPRYITMFRVQVALPCCKMKLCCRVVPVHDFPYIITHVFGTKIMR